MSYEQDGQMRRQTVTTRRLGTKSWVAVLLVSALALAGVAASSAWSASPRFYPDDPLWTDADCAVDASRVAELEDANSYDFLVNTFGHPGERADVRAGNVNTVDEVPDSTWFTNRIGRRDMDVAEIVRGPDTLPGVDLSGWMVSGGKGSGVQPGFRMVDPSGQIFQIEFDPPSNPELASGAEIIGTALYHAIGYHVVEVYLAELDRDTLVIQDAATIRDPLNGKRLPNGRYRVLASKFAPGKPLGNFRYYRTRPDDPNDIVPHEHRRELRGARVFAAWLNHDDSRGINSLDMLQEMDGRACVKHYMFDFGSILGSGTVYEQRLRAGNEYIFEARPGWLTLATLGLYVRPWMTIDYPDVPPSVGRIEAERFDPALWKPEYPNPAFENMRPDDAFWAARIVSQFSDAAIRGVVEKARYSDPAATDYMTRTIIERRNKVVATWINGVTPVVAPALGADGTLAFRNAAVDASAATPAERYTLEWFNFDNNTNTPTPVGEPVAISGTTAKAPAGLKGDFVGVTITGTHKEHPGWSTPARFYFRRSASGWTLVGVERG